MFPWLCARKLGTKQGSYKKENLVESEGLALGCARAHVAGSLEAGPAFHQRRKGKHRKN